MTVAIEQLVWSKIYNEMAQETCVTFVEQTNEVCLYQPDLIGSNNVILDFKDLEIIYKKIKKNRKKHGNGN